MQEDLSGEVKSKVRSKDGWGLLTEKGEKSVPEEEGVGTKTHRQDREQTLSY